MSRYDTLAEPQTTAVESGLRSTAAANTSGNETDRTLRVRAVRLSFLRLFDVPDLGERSTAVSPEAPRCALEFVGFIGKRFLAVGQGFGLTF
ncbi:hypothetical protein [Rhodococcus sovatensis]|uniref:Uncharacterized protein n=1 Tax=Rhodococcus sovatensis TaxID=1805840 RepID=A0ABZ2PC53_9NOCA